MSNINNEVTKLENALAEFNGYAEIHKVISEELTRVRAAANCLNDIEAAIDAGANDEYIAKRLVHLCKSEAVDKSYKLACLLVEHVFREGTPFSTEVVKALTQHPLHQVRHAMFKSPAFVAYVERNEDKF